MKTYTFEETFATRDVVTLTEVQAESLNGIKCELSKQPIGLHEALVKVLIPIDTKEGSVYKLIIAKR